MEAQWDAVLRAAARLIRNLIRRRPLDRSGAASSTGAAPSVAEPSVGAAPDVAGDSR